MNTEQKDEDIQVMNDEALEFVYEELNELRELVERDREVIKTMQQLIISLQGKIDFLEAALKANTKPNNKRGKND